MSVLYELVFRNRLPLIRQLAVQTSVDWSQAFLMGLLGGGGIMVLLALVHFCRAMFASREDSKQFETQQPIYLGAMGLGIVMILGGLFMRGSTGTTTNSSDLSSYVEFVSKEGHFRAKFPGTPKEQTQGVMGLKIKLFTVEESGGMFGVAYLDMPGGAKTSDKQVEESFNNARKAMLKNMDAKLIREDRITLQGKYPGREIRANVPSKGAEMYCSIYMVKDRVYQIMVVGKTSWLNSDKARKFLNSFALR